ncbi:Uncharacterised protein [Klebsiella pneumoniae]|nr:Uncharacterised protein [Klebsiella pneumoniae]SXX10625.1 Uncharacterised protein [Klebsiella pneumoniae]SXX35631.1 Uncharacterised protein [Klebsiella pneumoniae]
MVLFMDQREKAKLLAYVLKTEWNAKQKHIALVLQVSEGTISLWVKEMSLKHQIYNLSKELQEVRSLAQGLVSSGKIEKNPGFLPSL